MLWREDRNKQRDSWAVNVVMVIPTEGRALQSAYSGWIHYRHKSTGEYSHH